MKFYILFIYFKSLQSLFGPWIITIVRTSRTDDSEADSRVVDYAFAIALISVVSIISTLIETKNVS